MKINKIDILLIFIIIISIATYNLWHVINIKNFFQKSEAVFISLICYAILVLVKESLYKRFKITIFLSHLLLFFSLNNLIDNLFFDPFKIQINEYIFAIVAIIASLLITKKHNTHAKI